MFRNMGAVSSMAVFCSCLMSCFPGMFFMLFLNDFQTAPAAPIITGVPFVFIFHAMYFYRKIIYFKIITILSPLSRTITLPSAP